MKSHSPGPWQMATSCSFRRIIDANGREIIGGTIQRSDNHPDLHFANGGYEGPDARLVLAAPALLAMVEKYASECVECGGTGSSPIGATVIGGEIEEVSMDCAGCIDIRALIKSARGNQS